MKHLFNHKIFLYMLNFSQYFERVYDFECVIINWKLKDDVIILLTVLWVIYKVLSPYMYLSGYRFTWEF